MDKRIMLGGLLTLMNPDVIADNNGSSIDETITPKDYICLNWDLAQKSRAPLLGLASIDIELGYQRIIDEFEIDDNFSEYGLDNVETITVIEFFSNGVYMKVRLMDPRINGTKYVVEIDSTDGSTKSIGDYEHRKFENIMIRVAQKLGCTEEADAP